MCLMLFLFFQKLFAIQMAEFKLTIKCMWNSETGDFKPLTDESIQDKEDESESMQDKEDEEEIDGSE